MITGVPTAAVIRAAALRYLGIAWDDALSLIAESEQWSELDGYGEPGDERLADAHQQAAHHRLAVCEILLQQGTELLLKSRIAEVSPFLLLDLRSGVPSGAQKTDVEFSDFRTIDASSLATVHDAVAAVRLPEGFLERYENARRLRNALVHLSVAQRVLDAKEIIKKVLGVAGDLLGSGVWLREHWAHTRASLSWAYDEHGGMRHGLYAEFQQVEALLSNRDFEREFGFKKTDRRYLCPDCQAQDAPLEHKSAVLLAGRKRLLRCFVCAKVLSARLGTCPDCGTAPIGRHGFCFSCGGDDGSLRAAAALKQQQKKKGKRS